MLLLPDSRIQAARQMVETVNLNERVGIVSIEGFIGQNVEEFALFGKAGLASGFRRSFMVDTVSKEARSKIMAKVVSEGTAPEMKVRRALFKAGFRFRLHSKDLPGKPDIVFPRKKFAVFVHGCFWHWHGCKRSRMPRSNSEYWNQKIRGNIERDEQIQGRVQALGWHYRAIWECELSSGVERLTDELLAKVT